MRTPRISRTCACAVVTLAVAVVGAQAQILYSDSFSGTGVSLNGVGVEGGTGAGTLWSANAPFFTDGNLNETVEGSAILPFDPSVNFVYTLTLSVSNITDRWVALGFARDALTQVGLDSLNDRFSNEAEGISWMLFRDHATDATQDIQLFGGLRTASGIADNNAAILHAQWNQLKIILDTSADLTGNTFQANFFLNNVSVTSSGLPVVVNQNVTTINYVGFSYDDSTTFAPILVDDFQLSVVAVPEPASFALIGLGLLAWIARLGLRTR